MIDFAALVAGPCMQTFGEWAKYQPQAGRAFGVVGVYNAPRREDKAATDLGEIETLTSFDCLASQFPAVPAKNDLLTLRGQLWRVAEALPDSVAMVALHIMLANDTQANLPATAPISATLPNPYAAP